MNAPAQLRLSSTILAALGTDLYPLEASTMKPNSVHRDFFFFLLKFVLLMWCMVVNCDLFASKSLETEMLHHSKGHGSLLHHDAQSGEHKAHVHFIKRCWLFVCFAVRRLRIDCHEASDANSAFVQLLHSLDFREAFLVMTNMSLCSLILCICVCEYCHAVCY